MTRPSTLCIDLGTTNSAVAVINPDTLRPEIIKNSQGGHTLPSVVLFLGQDRTLEDILIGQDALDNAWQNPDGLVRHIKRNMGDRDFKLSFFGKTYSPVDISALILKQLKADAEEVLGYSVQEAMITVPAYFDDWQRKDTIEAAKQAGLTVNTWGIINEPTAAAIHYGIDRVHGTRNVMIYDLGGGTFDVTILNVTGNVLAVKSTAGSAELGGQDWDGVLAEMIREAFSGQFGLDLSDDLMANVKLEAAAERYKIELSQRQKVTVLFSHEGHNLRYEVTRTAFEEKTAYLLEQTGTKMEDALACAEMTWQDIDEIILAGGSTRMPAVREYIAGKIGKPPQATVNPDFCVALGAAQRSGETGGIQVRDVTAHALGMVALHEGSYVNSIIIPKNTEIPVSQSKVFDNPYDDMTELDVKLLQGESRDPELCTLLKKHTFTGIQPMPKGQEKIEVTFSYSKNGTVEVFAKDLNTNNILEHTETEISILQLEPSGPTVKRETGFSNIALILDCSYSMEGEDFRNAKKAAKDFLKNTIEKRGNIQVCLITIGGDSNHDTKLVVPFTNRVSKVASVIGELEVGGSTPMDRSIDIAISAFEGQKGRSLMVIVSDGMPNNKSSALNAAEKASEKGFECSTIGIGSGDHNEFLEQISTMSHFGDLASSDLQKSFESIFREI